MGEETAAADAIRPAPSRRRGMPQFLRDVAVILVIALLISFLVKTFLVRSFYIPSTSMVHTLEVDDRIIVNELVPGLVPVSRGDVVVFRDPGGWLHRPPVAEQGPWLPRWNGSAP